MSNLQDQVQEMNDAIMDLQTATAAEKEEVGAHLAEQRARIDALEKRVAEMPDVDLSNEIASIRATTDAIKAIVERPAPQPLANVTTGATTDAELGAASEAAADAETAEAATAETEAAATEDQAAEQAG